MSTKLETETSAAKTIQAYKDTASQIGLVLEPGNGIDNGDFPRHAYTNLKYIRRVNAVGKEHRKIINTISRAIVTVRDEKGKPTKKHIEKWDKQGTRTIHERHYRPGGTEDRLKKIGVKYFKGGKCVICHSFPLYKVICKQEFGTVVEYYCREHFDKSDIK